MDTATWVDPVEQAKNENLLMQIAYLYAELTNENIICKKCIEAPQESRFDPYLSLTLESI